MDLDRLCVIYALTDKCKEWFDNHLVVDSHQRTPKGGIFIERGMTKPIVEALIASGFVREVDFKGKWILKFRRTKIGESKMCRYCRTEQKPEIIIGPFFGRHYAKEVCIKCNKVLRWVSKNEFILPDRKVTQYKPVVIDKI